MNQENATIHLREFMDAPEGWGRAEGRKAFQRLLEFVEAHKRMTVFRVSMRGVKRVDMSFASETLVEVARRYRGSKGFCIVDLDDEDVIENWDGAAAKKGQPLYLWADDQATIIGAQPTRGTRDALLFALNRGRARAAEFVETTPGMSIANASSKFKHLWEQGFLLRQEEMADVGGVEFVYQPIG
jgi:hypothetical protein